MDYYFAAADDAAALASKEHAGGPTPESPFRSVEAKDVMACPHLELLVGFATGRARPSLAQHFRTLWPRTAPGGAEMQFDAGPTITRLPDCLRDDLSYLKINPALAAGWASELPGYRAEQAGKVARAIVALAASARDEELPLYWWSEM